MQNLDLVGMLRRIINRGGPGSGHHGHKGRPGKVGGSLPSYGASAPAHEVQGVLFHGTLRKFAKDIGKVGLVPSVGDLVEQAYGEYLGDEWVDADGNPMLEALTYFAGPESAELQNDDDTALESAFDYVRLRIAMAEGKSINEVTWEDVRKKGLLLVVGEEELDWIEDGLYLKGEEEVYDLDYDEDTGELIRVQDLYGFPIGPEPGDYFTTETVEPTQMVFGDELVRLGKYLKGEIVALGPPEQTVMELRGGPGSGHFGHEGRPGERGGSLPSNGVGADEDGGEVAEGEGDYQAEPEPEPEPEEKRTPYDWLPREEKLEISQGGEHPDYEWEHDNKPGPTIVFHGSSQDLAEKIAQEGLKVGKQWQKRPPSVYFTTEAEDAMDWAEIHARGRGGGRFVLVEFEVPDNLDRQVKFDGAAFRDLDMRHAYRVEANIAPEHIRRLYVYEASPSHRQESRLVDEIVLRREDLSTVYTVVALIEPEMERRADQEGEVTVILTRRQMEAVREGLEAAHGIYERTPRLVEPNKAIIHPGQPATDLLVDYLEGWQDNRAAQMAFAKLSEVLAQRGGPGSGHYGHKGRPGQVGGSLPSDGGGGSRVSDSQGDFEGDTGRDRFQLQSGTKVKYIRYATGTQVIGRTEQDAAALLAEVERLEQRSGLSLGRVIVTNSSKPLVEYLTKNTEADGRVILNAVIDRISRVHGTTFQPSSHERDPRGQVVIYMGGGSKSMKGRRIGDEDWRLTFAHEFGHFFERNVVKYGLQYFPETGDPSMGEAYIGIEPNLALTMAYTDLGYPTEKHSNEYFADMFSHAVSEGNIWLHRFRGLGYGIRRQGENYDQSLENMRRLIDLMQEGQQQRGYKFRAAPSDRLIEVSFDGEGTEWLLVEAGIEVDPDQILIHRGGPGSGHFGHAGRPGQVGGSQPSGGGSRVAEGGGDFQPEEESSEFWRTREPSYVRESYNEGDPHYQMAAPGEEDARLLGWKPQSQTVVWVRPSDYLDMIALHMGQGYGERARLNEGTVEKLKERMRQGLPIDALFLDYEWQPGQEQAKVVQQEGRHRSWAAIDLGIEYVPVIEYWRDERGTYWRLEEDEVPWESASPFRSYHQMREGEVAEINQNHLGMVYRGGPGSGHFGHKGRPGQVGGSQPSGGGSRVAEGGGDFQPSEDIFVGVPADILEPGSDARYLFQQGIMQPTGAPIRGREVIAWDDERIPETVFHMTTNLPGIFNSGEVSARGEGGLGGDKYDQIVSTTIDERIARQLVADMRMVVDLAHEFYPTMPRSELGEGGEHKWLDPQTGEILSEEDRKDWGRRFVEALNEHAGGEFEVPVIDDVQLESYVFGDWLRQFYMARKRHTGVRDPVVYTDPSILFNLQVEEIGYVRVPRENLNTGALLTDFDLDRKTGLAEVRIYGDLPLQGAEFVNQDQVGSVWEEEMLLSGFFKPEAVERGGPGSGHFGHEGRPGEVGGSLPSDGAGQQVAEGQPAYASGKPVEEYEYLGGPGRWRNFVIPRYPEVTERERYSLQRRWISDQLRRAFEQGRYQNAWKMSKDEFIVGIRPDDWEYDPENPEHSLIVTFSSEVEDIWEKSVGEALSLGLLTEGEARKKGYFPSGEDWMPLPDELYHVTTAASAVLEDRLRTREELELFQGTGLGGGSSDTISFTTDLETARGIEAGIQEAQAVAQGKIGPREILEAAIAGQNADKEYVSDIMRYFGQHDFQYREGMEFEDLPLTQGLRDILEGVVSKTDILFKTPEEFNEKHPAETEWVPDPLGMSSIRGDGAERYMRFIRPATEEEQIVQVFELYKKASFFRDIAGGPLDPLFFSSDPVALAAMPASEIRTFRVRPVGGAQGYQMSGLGEWRTKTGKAVEIVETLDFVEDADLHFRSRPEQPGLDLGALNRVIQGLENLLD